VLKTFTKKNKIEIIKKRLIYQKEFEEE